MNAGLNCLGPSAPWPLGPLALGRPLNCYHPPFRDFKERPVPNFPGVDYMEIDSLLSEEELMVRQTVRDFVDDEILPIIEDAHRQRSSPPPRAENGRDGPFRIDHQRLRLPGLSHVAYGLIMQELERGDSGLARSFLAIGPGHYPIYTYGSKAQKDE